VANTAAEARQLVDLYAADRRRVAVIPPGVDLGVFSPGGPDGRRVARRRLGLPADADLLLFVGRIQPLKAPDVLLRAAADLVARHPERRSRLIVAVLGGPSGSGVERPEELHKLAGELGIGDLVVFSPPVTRAVLADWYRSADLVAVPSYSESFGLVAVEAQACGTPVVAAAVGGLPTAVQDGVTGVLVDGHDPGVWSRTLGALLDAVPARDRMAAAAVAGSHRFSWDRTVDATIDLYAQAVHDHRRADGGAVPLPASPALGALAVAP
jgi:D-inositol-3-phosphate glycosyltransferase